MKFLITGGAGFIGSAVVRYIINQTQDELVNVDKLTYAGNLESVTSVSSNERYDFEHVDICNRGEIDRVFTQYQPDAVVHLAAESHVDRSIDGPAVFIETNIFGTYTLLEAARKYWQRLDKARRQKFRFHHVSTDEVYGDLGAEERPFSETSAYDPSSPYSASKGAADHLVRAWGRTYDLPVVISNCSNNFGPYHFPEKLIPLMILNAIEGKPLPLYGDGKQIRDWLYVEDHASAIHLVATRGEIGETYNIGSSNEMANIDVVKMLCSLMQDIVPEELRVVDRYHDLITFVEDRPGHDKRYAINAEKISRDLGWKPNETFESGLRKTITWFLENKTWWSNVLDGSYSRERLGVGNKPI